MRRDAVLCNILVMAMSAELLLHDLLRILHPFWRTKVGVCQRLCKEAGAAAENQRILVRDRMDINRRSKAGQICLLIIPVKVLHHLHERFCRNLIRQNSVIQRKLEMQFGAGTDTLSAQRQFL